MKRILLGTADPRFQIVMNSVFAVVFLAMIPVTIVTGLKNSVPFLVAISLWALVAAHWSSALAAYAAKLSAENPAPDKP